MTLMQHQGMFIKCSILFSGLGALELLFLILNPIMRWATHMDVAER